VTVTGKRLRKHVPVVEQQILNNAIAGVQQWKRGVSTWSVPRCYEQGTKSVRDFCMGDCEERTRVRQAEEFSPIEAFARERREKTGKA
jgi:hypothetical protein